jgi:hypothetical protein
MTWREHLQRRPWLGVTGGTAMIVLALLLVWRSRSEAAPPPLPQMWFTTDDGQTLFSAPADRVPPFLHEGKEAVRAYVFRPPGQPEKRQVRYLLKFTPEAIAQMGGDLSFDQQASVAAALGGKATLVKRPGDGTWLSAADPRAQPLMSPGDSLATEAVMP